jgi:hypothetical protein
MELHKYKSWHSLYFSPDIVGVRGHEKVNEKHIKIMVRKHQRCREDGRIILKQILGTFGVKTRKRVTYFRLGPRTEFS